MGLLGNEQKQDIKKAMQTIKFSIKHKNALADYQKKELYYAISTLNRYSKNAKVTKPFIQVIVNDCGNWETIQYAIQSLGRIGDRRAVKPFLQLATDASKGIMLQQELIRALGLIKDRRAVKPLLRVLHDSKYNPLVRGEASRALGSIHDNRAIKPLHQILNNANEERAVLAGVIKALGDFEEQTAIETVLQVIERYMASGDDEISGQFGLVSVTEEAIRFLVKFSNDQVKKDILLKYILCPRITWGVRNSLSTKWVGKTGNEWIERNGFKVPLEWHTGGWTDTEGFKFAVDTLKNFNDPQIMKALVDASEEGNIKAISALVEIGDSQVIEQMIGVLCKLLPSTIELQNMTMRSLKGL